MLVVPNVTLFWLVEPKELWAAFELCPKPLGADIALDTELFCAGLAKDANGFWDGAVTGFWELTAPKAEVVVELNKLLPGVFCVEFWPKPEAFWMPLAAANVNPPWPAAVDEVPEEPDEEITGKLEPACWAELVFVPDVFLWEEAENEVNWFVVAGRVKGEFPNEDAEDKSWTPEGIWVVATVDVSDTFGWNPVEAAFVKFIAPDDWVVTTDCAWSEVAVCDPPADEVIFDDPGLLNKLANSPDPDACWDCIEATTVPWDCKTGALVTGPPWTPVILCGTPVEGAGAMRLWVVVVVIVPALVTAPVVGIFNNDEEVEVVAAVDETALVSEKWKGTSPVRKSTTMIIIVIY